MEQMEKERESRFSSDSEEGDLQSAADDDANSEKEGGNDDKESLDEKHFFPISGTSSAWRLVRQMRKSHPMFRENGPTHFCTLFKFDKKLNAVKNKLCNALLSPPKKSKGHGDGFDISCVKRHLDAHHSFDPSWKKHKEERITEKTANLISDDSVGSAASLSSKRQSHLNFNVSINTQKVDQMRLLVYAKSSLSLSFLSEVYLKNWVVHLKPDASFLSRADFSEYLAAEFNLFRIFIIFMLEKTRDCNYGNPFAQIGTLFCYLL